MDKSWSWTFLCPQPVTPCASDSSISPLGHDDEMFYCEDDEDNHENVGRDDFTYHELTLLFCHPIR